MYDVLIKNGRVFDGLGAPSQTCDVAIKDGIIMQIAPAIDDDATEVIDASRLWVTPGFIDIHTHYDLELEIAPELSESVRHGVTTVVMGNCSLSIAMGKPQDLADIFLRVEALPKQLIDRWLGTSVQWETTSDYLNHLRHDLRPGPNVTALLGHSALRCKVMGFERSLSEKATKAEIATMRELARQALQDGFIGISIDMIPWHMVGGEFRGRTLPSQHANYAEYKALAEVCLEVDGVFQLTPNVQKPLAFLDLLRLCLIRRRGKPLRVTLLTALDSVIHRSLWRLFPLFGWGMNKILGCNTRFQTITEPFTIYSDGPITTLFEEFESGVQLNNCDTREERLALWAKPGFREWFVAEWRAAKFATSPRDLSLLQIIGCPHRQWEGKSVHDVASLSSKDPVECFVDLLIEFDDDLRWYTTGANDRYVQRLTLMGDEDILPGFTDAGAHNRNLAYYDGTVSFLRQAMQTQFMSMERAISRCTGESASWFQVDTGVLEEGAKADVVLLDPEQLKKPIPDAVLIDDPLLENASRMVKRDPDGVIKTVFINGKRAFDQGQQVEELGREPFGEYISLSEKANQRDLHRKSPRNRVSPVRLDHPFEKYWEVFVLKHQNPVNVFFHLLGMVYGYALIAVAIMVSPWYLLLMPISNLIGLYGHWKHERSYIDPKDAAFDMRAVLSLNKLLLYSITGKYKGEVKRVREELERYLAENRRVSLDDPIDES